MISRISTKILVFGLLLIHFRKVITLTIFRPHKNHLTISDNSEGSGYERGHDPTWEYESHSRSFDDYDDEGLASGWVSSGDDTFLPTPMDSFCAFPGLEPRLSGSKIQLSTSFEQLCGTSKDSDTRKRCLKAICQCFSADRTYSIQFEKHFSIDCVATSVHGGGRRQGGGPRDRNTVPTKGHTITSYPTHKYSTAYDDDDDDDDGDDNDGGYSVEIDTSRVEEMEKSREQHGILSKTGLLASIMGGTIIGLLCAVLLAMFVVYRVKKYRGSGYASTNYHQHHQGKKSPPCPPLKGYTKNFDECDFYA